MSKSDRDWHTRTVLCTGASGMVGSWVVNALLAEGANVVALVRDSNRHSEFARSGADARVAIVPGQLQNFAVVERAINHYEVDTVIHLGAQAIVAAAERSPLETLESNIRGTYNVLEACRQHSDLVARVVIASSDKAYGDNRGKPYSEDLPLVARHPYDVSKTCADLLAQMYAYTYELPVAIARCGNIFGGGDFNWSRIVPGTIRSLVQNESPQIRSDGTYVRDYLYVKDAAAAYLTLANQAADPGVRGQAFNFSPESPRSVLEVVSCIAELMGKRHLQPRILDHAQHEIRHQVLAADKAHARLGWKPSHALEQGLRETIAWYERYFEDQLAGVNQRAAA